MDLNYFRQGGTRGWWNSKPPCGILARERRNRFLGAVSHITRAAICAILIPSQFSSTGERRPVWRGTREFIDRAVKPRGRYVLFEHDRDRHAFVFRDFGAGIPEWAKYCLSGARGLVVENLHDDPFGLACTVAYRQTLEKFSPTLQVVDANIRWPKYGTLRSCYWRLMYPW